LVDTGTTLDQKIDAIDTVVDAIKAVTDNLPDSGALTTLATNVSAILTDTGTTLDGKIDQLVTAVITNAAGTDIAADVAAVAALVAASAIRTALGLASANLDTQLTTITAQRSVPTKNSAFTFTFKMVDATDFATPETGLTVTATV